MATTYDFSDVRGNDLAVAALTHAAARRTGVVLMGPPGVGKTMIARRASGLLGPLDDLGRAWMHAEYTAIGLDGNGSGGDYPTRDGQYVPRPLRAPHHTVSAAAMAGAYGRKHRIACPQARSLRANVPIKCTCERSNADGGMERVFRPGECHLARFGILFLDELIEFPRSVIEVIAETVRAMSPRTRPWIIASAQPCPCGWRGSIVRECTCGPDLIDRWTERLSRSLRTLEIGEQIKVRPMGLADLRSAEPGTSTAELRRIVIALETMPPAADVARAHQEGT